LIFSRTPRTITVQYRVADLKAQSIGREIALALKGQRAAIDSYLCHCPGPMHRREDGGRWALPGGWADVNRTAAENVAKEVQEESGYTVRVRKLASVCDRTRQGHPAAVFSCYKMLFICEVIGGTAATGLETADVGWFTEDNLPNELSLARTLPGQIRRMFEHARDPALPTDFD
jgi:ADP-ribose pyrophosphatase YjhB (NUDIX family)